MPVSTERYDLLRTRVERFTRLLHAVEEGDVNAVHRTRVASRRLREVLPVLRLEPDAARKLGRRLRKVTERLGSMRELDVLLAVIAELRESGRHPDGPLARVAASVSDERDRLRARLLAKGSHAELRRVATKLEKTVASLELADVTAARTDRPPRSWRWAIDARVARRAAAVADAVAAAGTVYLPERLHVVRIATKKLRYAVEVLADISPTKSKGDLRQLRRVQDVLGRLHDLHVLSERVRDIQTSLTPPDVTAWREFNALAISIENDCRRLHGRYMRQATALAVLCARLAGRADEHARDEAKAQKSRARGLS